MNDARTPNYVNVSIKNFVEPLVSCCLAESESICHA